MSIIVSNSWSSWVYVHGAAELLGICCILPIGISIVKLRKQHHGQKRTKWQIFINKARLALGIDFIQLHVVVQVVGIFFIAFGWVLTLFFMEDQQHFKSVHGCVGMGIVSFTCIFLPLFAEASGWTKSHRRLGRLAPFLGVLNLAILIWTLCLLSQKK